MKLGAPISQHQFSGPGFSPPTLRGSARQSQIHATTSRLCRPWLSELVCDVDLSILAADAPRFDGVRATDPIRIRDLSRRPSRLAVLQSFRERPAQSS
jgi:hypothetical protein